jgi:hypothetical protein
MMLKSAWFFESKYLRSDDDEAMGGHVLEQLGVEVVVGEVAVQEDDHRVLPCVARRGYQQRLWRAPRGLGLLDLGKAGAMASMVEHVSC